MKKVLKGALILHMAGLFSYNAMGFEFHGYMRSGIGASDGGTDQVCFKNNNIKFNGFRLGNECETYMETLFSQNYSPGESAKDPYFKGTINFSYIMNAERDYESTAARATSRANPDGTLTGIDLSSALTVANREAFVEAGNVVLPGSKLWIGKRYYMRRDVHTMDFFYMNTSGPGIGLSDIGAGPGKLHLALFRIQPESGNGPVQNTLDLRYNELELGPGKLETILEYATTSKSDAVTGAKTYEPLTGAKLSLIYGLSVMGGTNTTVFQHGQGLFGANPAGWVTMESYGNSDHQVVARGDSVTKKSITDSRTTRFINDTVVAPAPNLSLGFVVAYQTTDFAVTGTDAAVIYAVGTRPVYHVNPNFDVALELGRVHAKDGAVNEAGNSADAVLDKVTIAPAWKPEGGFWARPSLRLFVTHAQWSEKAMGAGGPVYADAKSGTSVGAQFETWW